MTRYMIQVTPTPQNMAALLKNPEDRTEPVRRVIEAVGGSLEQYYNSILEHTTFVIAYVPDEVSISALTAAIFAGGGLTSCKAMPIMTASESVEVFKKAANIAYRPPGG
jgi:uncharacterized protein with GYD domain